MSTHRCFAYSRGWSTDEWSAAIDRLVNRGLVTVDGAATADGRALRERIERQTDDLASQPFRRLGDDRVQDLLLALAPAAGAISTAGEIPFPNPMGLPRVAS